MVGFLAIRDLSLNSTLLSVAPRWEWVTGIPIHHLESLILWMWIQWTPAWTIQYPAHTLSPFTVLSSCVQSGPSFLWTRCEHCEHVADPALERAPRFWPPPVDLNIGTVGLVWKFHYGHPPCSDPVHGDVCGPMESLNFAVARLHAVTMEDAQGPGRRLTCEEMMLTVPQPLYDQSDQSCISKEGEHWVQCHQLTCPSIQICHHMPNCMFQIHPNPILVDVFGLLSDS